MLQRYSSIYHSTLHLSIKLLVMCRDLKVAKNSTILKYLNKLFSFSRKILTI